MVKGIMTDMQTRSVAQVQLKGGVPRTRDKGEAQEGCKYGAWRRRLINHHPEGNLSTSFRIHLPSWLSMGSTAGLPTYEPPSHPLTPAAQETLRRTHDLNRLNRHLDIANTTLTDVAGEVNDRYWHRADNERKRKARCEQQQLEDDQEEAERQRDLERMEEEVDAMTARLEESVRKVIDTKAAVEGVGTALVEVATNLAQGNGAVAATQSTLGASQFRLGRSGRRRGRGGGGLDRC